MATGEPTPEERARQVWALGSYAEIAPHFLGMAAHLVAATGIGPGDEVLDVGCGTGNVAITAARRGADVTGLDVTPEMLEAARENAAVAGVDDVDWHEGTATDLPFDDDRFDVTLSCVGHMFAVPADAAARELLRVTRPGGTVAFTSWTPSSVVPAMGKLMSEYLPPNPDAPEPPFRWGDPTVVHERLGEATAETRFETGTVWTPVLSPTHYWEDATTQSGMFIVALDSVAEDERPALEAAMLDVIDEFFDKGRNAVGMDYRLTNATVA